MGTISLILPQIGLSDSTEDVKIPNALTTIQTWANGNVDPTNLNPTSGVMHLAVRAVSAAATANVGDWIVATGGGYTVTLPPPAVNALVAVTSKTATGTIPTTVAGTNIFGVGLSGVSSFLLGTAMATVVLQSDGTNWLMVSGQQDTGWVALSFPAGFANGASGSFYAPAYRLVGKTARLRGAVLNNTGSTQIGGAIMATGAPAPAGVVSSTAIIPTVGGSTGVQVSTGGSVVQATGNSWLNGQVFSLDGVQYDIT